MLDILGKRYIFFAISALLILPGLIIMAIWGLPLSIDFRGGTMLDLEFDGPVASTEQVHDVYNRFGLVDAQATSAGDNLLQIRSSFMEEETRVQVIEALEAETGST